MEKPGLIVAPLTPFTADLDVDEPALRREIDYVVRDCRATMVVAAGVETQEYNYLGLEQRKALIRHTMACVDGRVPVMVGISHPSFKTAVALAHEAERLGAAAVQVLAPLRPFPSMRLPVIAVSGYATEDDEQRTRAAGFDGYVRKPFVESTLAAAVDRVLHERGIERRSSTG